MTPNWPMYLTGPHENMHALGVVSVNFANFERALTWVFAAVSQKPEKEARQIHARDGITNCIGKIEQSSRVRGWSGPPNEQVRHFITAARILVQNRNLLMHSVVVSDLNNNATLYKTHKKSGDTEMVRATTAQIRAVADDLHRYFSFARHLANCIAVKVDEADRKAGAVAQIDWTEPPPLPKALKPRH